MKTILSALFFFAFLSFSFTQDVVTTQEGDVTIYPLLHATMVLDFGGTMVFVDPFGGSEHFAPFGSPDLVLITDIHGDHMNHETLTALDLTNATVLGPPAVVEELGEINMGAAITLKNDETATWQKLGITGIPMYNLPENEESRHPKGRGNGYLIEFGGKRFYISGDTEDIVEMRSLKNIDVAFVCMNLPYTMDIEQAASAVIEFKPAIIYPFHYRGGSGKFSDIEAFSDLVNQGDGTIEVRLRNWYP
jgi:L-ascorbate metabolism protein UlaG (beta-lactamase superfamily)